MNNPAKIADGFIWFLEFLSQKPYRQPYMYKVSMHGFGYLWLKLCVYFKKRHSAAGTAAE